MELTKTLFRLLAGLGDFANATVVVVAFTQCLVAHKSIIFLAKGDAPAALFGTGCLLFADEALTFLICFVAFTRALLIIALVLFTILDAYTMTFSALR